MDKLVKFFTNRWLKFGVSFLSLIYPAIVGFESWLMMGFYFEPTHDGALYTSYIFINLLFLGIMSYTRKQIITRICTLVTPLLAFAVLIFGFGNWLFVIPPIVVCVFTFFVSGTSETTKTIIGTMYLIMYVVGVFVFLTVRMLLGRVSLLDVDLSTRSTNYLISPDGKYRVVTYVQPEKDTRHRTVSFYIEKTDGDVSLPFIECKRALGSVRLITSNYANPAKLEWKEDKLYIDGRLKEFSFDNDALSSFLQRGDADDDDESETSSKTTSSNTSKVTSSVSSSSEASSEEESDSQQEE